jgi:homocysteine S-methyltransferase
MKNDLRVSMPDEILLRMQKADTPDLARAEGIRIATEMLEAARPMVQGVQVSAPFGRYSSAVEILEVVLPKKSPGNQQGEAVHTVKPERSGVGNV